MSTPDLLHCPCAVRQVAPGHQHQVPDALHVPRRDGAQNARALRKVHRRGASVGVMPYKCRHPARERAPTLCTIRTSVDSAVTGLCGLVGAKVAVT